jgi:signal peptide peptidase SppA
MVRTEWMQEAVSAVQSGHWKPAVDGEDSETNYYESPGSNGIAVIAVHGHLTKRPSSFGGTSYLRLRQALRAAGNDGAVKSVVLSIDSPGGAVYGITDIAGDIRKLDAIKPVYAYAESGLCCSAAYWIASQCRAIYANHSAMVGNIGVYGVLADSSEMNEMHGLKYVLVSTGGVKGLGADGRVTEELVADYRREVFELATLFWNDVQNGRGFTDKQLDAVKDGRAFVGDQATPLGLIDKVATLDEVIMEITTMDKSTFSAAAAEHPEWLSSAAVAAIDGGDGTAIIKHAVGSVTSDELKAMNKGACDDIWNDGHKAGYECGATEGRELFAGELRAMREAIPNRDGFVIEQVVKGNDIKGAKAELSELLAVDMKAKADEAASEKKRADDLQKKLEAVSEGQQALVLSPSGKDETAAGGTPSSEIKDPAARAAAEWNEMSDDDKSSYISEDVFVAARTRELKSGRAA